METGRRDKWDALATLKSFDLGVSDEKSNNSVFHSKVEQIEIIQSPATTPISLLVQSLVQQLCSLLEKDVTKASQLYNTICSKLHSMNLIDDSYAMGEFEVMRSQYQRALYQLVTVANGTEWPMSLPETWPILQPSGLDWSRYHREFEELYFIASGGFGNVFKARHRLDNVEYAIKKVFIKSSDVDSVMSHLCEVKTIASLNHPNIVNYKAAWLEPMIESAKKLKKIQLECESQELTPLKTNKTSITYSNILKSFKTYDTDELIKENSQSDFVISFKNSNSMENETEIDDASEETSTTEDEKAICKLLNGKDLKKCSRVNLKWAVLYIQMSYCQKTLKQWLDVRNSNFKSRRKDSDVALNCKSNDLTCMDHSPHEISFILDSDHVRLLMEMFRQLVCGLHYIHSRGIIHHDIKPSNVFVEQGDSTVSVQLGDFGLACPLQRSHSGLALGTHLYAAPEQLDGQCNPKSDMYSLGILLLELVVPFDTDMERVKTITDLRKGQIPAQLTANLPKIAYIIGKLIQRRPNKRLDTAQLLEELKNLHENKEDTIRLLKEELVAKDEEIVKLKNMLAKLTAKSSNVHD